jgi:general secretion pathway protein D
VVKATPHVHGTEDITLDLDAEFKLITGTASLGMPVISNRKLVTQVRIPTGQWAVVAGLLSKSDVYSLSGLPVPLLPVKKQKDNEASEILILIKTSLLSLPPSEFFMSPLSLGTETRPRAPL